MTSIESPKHKVIVNNMTNTAVIQNKRGSPNGLHGLGLKPLLELGGHRSSLYIQMGILYVRQWHFLHLSAY